LIHHAQGDEVRKTPESDRSGRVVKAAACAHKALTKRLTVLPAWMRRKIIVSINGESFRLKDKRKAGIFTRAANGRRA
jgi:hypothetical protein